MAIAYCPKNAEPITPSPSPAPPDEPSPPRPPSATGTPTSDQGSTAHTAFPDLRIDLLRHEQHPSNSEGCGREPGAAHPEDLDLLHRGPPPHRRVALLSPDLRRAALVKPVVLYI